MSPSDSFELARTLVAAVVPDDISTTTGDEDLRDYGLDSVRIIDLIAAVRDAGGQIEYSDLIGGPTLDILAGAFASAPAQTDPEGTR